MLDLSFSQIAVLGAGLLLVLAGLAGLVPMLLNRRPRLSPRLKIDESLNPALHSAASYIRPLPPVATPAREVAPEAPARDFARAEDMSAELSTEEVSAAEELLARLFTIRMTLSEVTEEVRNLREAYEHSDEETIEDDAGARDDLQDIDEDPGEDFETVPPQRLPEAA